MQTILGAGGAIGNELARALTHYTNDIRLVSRTPQKVNPDDQKFPADLTRADETRRAIQGSEIVYLTAGLPYKTKLWESTWPVIMQNVIDACVEEGAKLVFFDNIYLYSGDNLNPIVEDSPVNPPSKKGVVRAKLVKMIWDAVENRNLKAVIARCADFYGPNVKDVSLLTELVLVPLSEGKTANWLVNDKVKHAFTFTEDAGRATALLGNSPEAYGQAWHLPTAQNPPTGKEWVEMAAQVLGVKPKYRVVSKGMVKFLGIFVPIMRSIHEMLYQYDKDYVFNSAEFEKTFSYTPTPYRKGLEKVVQMQFRK
ncbi:MAG: NAD-dependent epimerase/dehydratase family protein [Cryomorphaceae bacterium]|nr:NAD-dependent epimerase/dehydratase family protein [Flavobacteriales bacterium]